MAEKRNILRRRIGDYYREGHTHCNYTPSAATGRKHSYPNCFSKTRRMIINKNIRKVNDVIDRRNKKTSFNNLNETPSMSFFYGRESTR